MVQIIHRFHNSYPFELQKISENTFVQVYKPNLSEDELNHYKNKFKAFRSITSNHIIKLLKILKEESNLHIVYEYFPLSFEAYINQFAQTQNSKQTGRQILKNVKAAINDVIDALINAEIKSYLSLSNLALHKLSNNNYIIKLFIDPEFECLSIPNPSQKNKEHHSEKQSVSEQLDEFYCDQKKKLKFQIEDLLEKKFGKLSSSVLDIPPPNFVINGTKLIFHNKTDVSKDGADSNVGSSKSHQSWQKPVKINQKNEEKKFQIGNSVLEGQFNFKPEEFTKENTYILQENDYLESLEEEVIRLAAEKKKENSKSNIVQPIPETTKSKNASQNQDKSKQSKKEVIVQEKKPVTNTSENNIIEIKTQPIQKSNKYKMKITTSHQIQFEGDADSKEIQKDIISKIKSGELNLGVGDLRQSLISRDQTINRIDDQLIQIKQSRPSSKIDKRQINLLKDKRKNTEIYEEQAKYRKTQDFSDPPYLPANTKIKEIHDIIQKIGGLKSKLNTKEHPISSNSQTSINQHKTQEKDHFGSDNYTDKIKEAKNRAQQALKGYTKSKKH